MTKLFGFLAPGAIALLSLSACGGGGSDGGANLRLLNASIDHVTLDMYVDGQKSDERLAATDVGYSTASGYFDVEKGVFSAKLKRSGTASTLLSFSDESNKGSHVTYVAFGEPGRLASLKITEDESVPDTGKVKVQVLNASRAGAISVYLAEQDTPPEEQVAQFGNVDSGSRTEFLQMDSGVYRLRVTASGNASDLRLDTSGVELESGGVVSLALTATEGGVLLSAILLPQQGQPQVFSNDMARVRAANGVSLGSAITVRVAGSSLLTSATPGILSQYTLVQAGTVPVSLSIDGTAVPVSAQELAGGGDYTLVAWNEDVEPRLTLLQDDNRLPLTSGTSKLRLVNALSGLSDAINLSIDFFPIAEGVQLGAASGYGDVYQGTDIQFDVISATTATTLWTRDEITVESGRVYTLLMSGRDLASINGTLRRDR